MLGFFRAIRSPKIRNFQLLYTQSTFRFSNEEDSFSEFSEDEIPVEVYAAKRRTDFKKLYSTNYKNRIAGFATPEGTTRHFSKYNPCTNANISFNVFQSLKKYYEEPDEF